MEMKGQSKPNGLGNSSFQGRWLARFDLPKTGWRTAIRLQVRELPFCDPDAAASLLAFLFDDLPKLLKTQPDPQRELLAEALAWVCFSFWQCESAFPSFPENYAHFLREELLKPAGKRDPGAKAIADLLVCGSDADGADDRCGFNRLVLSDPAVIRESETLMHEGRYEFYLKAQEIFHEEAPWIPIAHSVRFDPIRKEVTGYKMDATAHHYFNKVDITGQ